MLCTKIMFSLLLTKSMTVLEEWLQVKERKNWIIRGTLLNVVHYINHNYQFYIDLNKLYEMC